MASPQNFITDDTTVKGNITTAGSLTIAGAVEGNVSAAGEVVILEDAVIKGDVSGPDVRVQGKVEGRVNATGRLVITTSGTVSGDISVRALLIEEGGTLQGQCSMGGSIPSPSFGAAKGSNGRSALPNLGAPPPTSESSGGTML